MGVAEHTHGQDKQWSGTFTGVLVSLLSGHTRHVLVLWKFSESEFRYFPKTIELEVVRDEVTVEFSRMVTSDRN